jgi:hypothetical protein
MPAGTPNVITGYRLTAQLQASLFVGWSNAHGNPDAACSSWSVHTGTSRVDAHTGPIQGFIQLYRPGTTHVIIRGRRIPVTWAELTAVGRGSGTAKRTYTHQAGVNWTAACGGTRPQPERVPTPDCDPRTFTTKTASILATKRRWNGTLEVGNANAGVSHTASSIDFLIAPGRDLFPTCPSSTKIDGRTGHYINRYITDLGAPVSAIKWMKLRNLRRGQPAVQISDHYGGRCDTHISPRECSFRLELDVWIKRIG